MIGRQQSGDQSQCDAARQPYTHQNKKHPPSRREQAWTVSFSPQSLQRNSVPIHQTPAAIRIFSLETRLHQPRKPIHVPHQPSSSSLGTTDEGPEPFLIIHAQLRTYCQCGGQGGTTLLTFADQLRTKLDWKSSSKMNRLFGAKSSAPKPTLNSAISNVLCSPHCISILTSSRSTSEWHRSTSNSPP